jgi:hypothetical protein
LKSLENVIIIQPNLNRLIMTFLNNLLHSEIRPSVIQNYHLIKTLGYAATHALGARVFTAVHPLAGAIVVGTYYASYELIDRICKEADICQDGIIAKTARSGLSTIAALISGVIAARVVGFPITFSTAVLLRMASIGVCGLGSVLVLATLAEAVYSVMMMNQSPVGDSEVFQNNAAPLAYNPQASAPPLG